MAWAAHVFMVETFIASFEASPRKLVLDFDATDDAVHGRQVGRFVHGDCDRCCFLSLHVFCGDHLLVSYLRPSNINGAKHIWAVLALLVKRLRRDWPHVRIVPHADRGFCCHSMLSWCERHGLGYIVGLAKNTRLNADAGMWTGWARRRVGMAAASSGCSSSFVTAPGHGRSATA